MRNMAKKKKTTVPINVTISISNKEFLEKEMDEQNRNQSNMVDVIIDFYKKNK